MSEYEINDLLQVMVAEGAEGLSLRVDERPVVHLRGERYPIEGPALTAENAEELLRSLADTRQIRELRERGRLEFIHNWRDGSQFAVDASINDDAVQLDLLTVMT